jgi:regulator of sigma D
MENGKWRMENVINSFFVIIFHFPFSIFHKRRNMMFNFFKKKTVTQTPPPPTPIPPQETQGKDRQTGNARAVLYNPQLVPGLKSEHKQMLNVYTTILAAVDRQDFAKVSQQLHNLDTLLRSHLLKEHIELYVYLEYLLTKGTQAFAEVHRLRLEMERISSDVTGFLNIYQTVPVNAATAKKFKQDFESIGTVLDKRILREETVLYPLYKPMEGHKTK